MSGPPGRTMMKRPSVPAIGRQLACLSLFLVALNGCAEEPIAPQFTTNCPAEALGTERVIGLTLESPPIIDQLAEREVVLTFDDGPHSPRTLDVMEVLSRECVQSAFFLRGDNAKRHPELTRAILLSGHELGAHGWAHGALMEMTLEGARADIERGLAAITDALANAPETETEKVRLFRFPYVASNDELEAIVDGLGLVNVPVQADGADWESTDPETIVERVMANLARYNNRGVILLHDPFQNAGKTADALIQRLKTDGYRIVAIRGVDTEQ